MIIFDRKINENQLFLWAIFKSYVELPEAIPSHSKPSLFCQELAKSCVPARVHRALALAFCSSQRWPRCPSHGLSHTLGPWIDGGEGKIKSRPGEGRFWSWIIPPKIGIPQDYIRLPSLSLSSRLDIGQIMIHEITWRNDKCPELGGMAFSHKPRSWQQAPLLLPHTHTAFCKTSCSTTVILFKSNYPLFTYLAEE